MFAVTESVVTERPSWAACMREPDVPVNVSEPLKAAPFAAADSVTTCEAPGAKDKLDGDAETPDGSPEI